MAHFSEEQRHHLRILYASQRLSLDQLPYTLEFDRILETFCRKWGWCDGHHAIWMELMRMRKDQTLPAKKKIRVANKIDQGPSFGLA